MSKTTVRTPVRIYNRKTHEHETLIIAVTVDWQEIANKLAPKAFENKSRKSKIVSGAVVGEIVSK